MAIERCIAISGCSGSGKSTALKIIAAEKFFVADFDSFSRKIIAENLQIQRKLEAIVGKKAFIDGQIDFKSIGNFFETNLNAEKIFEEWYQPILGREIEKFLANLECEIIFADVPFLAQKKIYNLFSEVWLIETTFENCCQRIKARNNYGYDKIKYLIERSKVSDQIYKAANKIIDNNGTLEEFSDKIRRNLK